MSTIETSDKSTGNDLLNILDEEIDEGDEIDLK